MRTSIYIDGFNLYYRALKDSCYKWLEFSVYYGHFLSHEVSFPQAPLTSPPTFTRVVKTEEKGSDVNLAAHVLNDAWLDKYDCAVVISNDSDLAEPLRLVREQNKKK